MIIIMLWKPRPSAGGESKVSRASVPLLWQRPWCHDKFGNQLLFLSEARGAGDVAIVLSIHGQGRGQGQCQSRQGQQQEVKPAGSRGSFCFTRSADRVFTVAGLLFSNLITLSQPHSTVNPLFCPAGLKTGVRIPENRSRWVRYIGLGFVGSLGTVGSRDF